MLQPHVFEGALRNPGVKTITQQDENTAQLGGQVLRPVERQIYFGTVPSLLVL